MRALKKNGQPLHYATYKSKTALKDEYGNETGEYVVAYNSPVSVNWSVSFVDSDAEVAMFGVESKNVIRIVADRMIDETSILWYGKTPHTPFADKAPDHNYVVAGVRPSLNEVVFYARKVDTFSDQPVIEDETES
jgi:hypothetical protein